MSSNKNGNRSSKQTTFAEAFKQPRNVSVKGQVSSTSSPSLAASTDSSEDTLCQIDASQYLIDGDWNLVRDPILDKTDQLDKANAADGAIFHDVLADHDAGRRGDPRCEVDEDVCAFPGHRGISRSSSSSTDGSHSEGDRQELRLVLVGSAGAGKSATGNSLLGRREFESRPAAVPVTRACQRGEGDWGGRALLVVDTPGFLSLTAPGEQLSLEMERCAQLSSPSPHALLLVLRAGQFTEEERKALQRIQRLFGEEALKFTVIVFTRKDDLGGTSIESFVRDSEKKLKELVRSCGGRICAFNNRATGAEREQQVRELIRMIDKMREGNGAGIKGWWRIRFRRFKDS
ncbi:GTPase IMAP family member 1-like [Lissotriton helveticus]